MNQIGAYNTTMLVNEGLQIMEANLGMGGSVYRGLDDDKSGRTKGDSMDITVPGGFVVRDAPSLAQDLSPTKINVKLDYWKEVKFLLGDKELAFTTDRIIRDHVRPAVYALTSYIEGVLAELVDDVPWYSDWSGTPSVDDLTSGVWTGMFNNKVDMKDTSKLFAMLDGTVYGKLLGNEAFRSLAAAGAGGADALRNGNLGRVFGFNPFPSQLAPTRTSATVADLAGAINNVGGYAAGTTTINFNGVSANAVFVKGDIIKVTGHVQQYVLTESINADGAGAVAGAKIYGSPFVQGGGLEAAVINTQVVTVVLAGGSGATKTNSIAFHEGAFALAMAKLPDHAGQQNNANITSIVDPKTGLSLRARTWYDPENSRYVLAFDTLFARKTLDGNKAWRVRR